MGYADPVQLADLLHGLTKRLRRAQAERLAPLGLTPAQERALRVIARSEEPPRMTELADQLGIVPRSLTGVIDSLEQAGLVRREIDPRNRRAILLHLTERGAAVRNDLRRAREHAAVDLFAPLPAARRSANCWAPSIPARHRRGRAGRGHGTAGGGYRVSRVTSQLRNWAG